MGIYNRGDADNSGAAGYRPWPWAYWLVGLAGLWLLISPWIFRYSIVPRAFWTGIILGALILIFAFVRPFVANRGHWVWWIIAGLGVLAIISPWVLAFTFRPGATWSAIIVGAIAVIVALIAIFGNHQPKTTTQ